MFGRNKGAAQLPPMSDPPQRVAAIQAMLAELPPGPVAFFSYAGSGSTSGFLQVTRESDGTGWYVTAPNDGSVEGAALAVMREHGLSDPNASPDYEGDLVTLPVGDVAQLIDSLLAAMYGELPYTLETYTA